MPEERMVKIPFEVYDKLYVNASLLLQAIDSASRVKNPCFEGLAYQVEFSEKDREAVLKVVNMVRNKTWDT